MTVEEGADAGGLADEGPGRRRRICIVGGLLSVGGKAEEAEKGGEGGGELVLGDNHD